jgi:HD-like signal output (HDOD) protein
VTDLVTKDPGLCVQVLVAANRLERDDTEPVEDIRTAVNLLGEIRLSSLAKAVPAVAERFFRSTPITWTQYWTFQVGVGRVARFVCDNLEMTDIAPYAYAAGLMHDIGKLILMRIFPFALPAMAGHAKANGIPLAEAEQRYTGWTSRKIGERFAQQSGLPPTYGDVIRWADNPEAATDHRDLVAAVALARELCHKSHLGQSFDFVKEAPVVVEALPAWSILQQRAFVGFNLRAFEAAAYAFCLKQKQELAGREQWHGAG